METTIDFRGSSIRHLVLAGDAPRENHEDATIRLLIQRERRRYEQVCLKEIIPYVPEEKRIILTGRE